MVVQELQEMAELFGKVALSDPLSAVSLAMGALLVGASSLAFGYLAARGAMTLFSPTHGQGPPRQAE